MWTKATGYASLLALASYASAATLRIDVGQNGLTFSPDTIKANMGDILDFHFHSINHSVVMGDFSNPCAPAKTGGFFSGFMPVSSGEAADSFQVEVNTTDPIFFYCSQPTLEHCKNGMSGVVNPSSSQTLNAYQSAAQSVSSVSNPVKVFGGKLVSSGSASASPSPTPSPNTGGGGGAYGGGGSSSGAAADVRGPALAAIAFAFGLAAFLLD